MASSHPGQAGGQSGHGRQGGQAGTGAQPVAAANVMGTDAPQSGGGVPGASGTWPAHIPKPAYPTADVSGAAMPMGPGVPQPENLPGGNHPPQRPGNRSRPDLEVGSRVGATPDDIPPAENDSVLAAQIRALAESETDPVKREAFWNEYRKVSGLKEKR